MQAHKTIIRNSSVIVLPQQFVTVQIHNSSTRKKLKNHRESILNEMQNTQDLLDSSLNKNLRHPKSKFTPNFKKNVITSLTTRKVITTQGSKIESKPQMRTEINRKLKQLCNISKHFDQACEYRKKIVPTMMCQNQFEYSLPVVSPYIQSLQQKKAKEDILEHRNMVKDWRSKVRQGRDFIKKIKLKNPLKFKDLNEQKEAGQQSHKKTPSLKSLRDIYFSQIRQQRKTAPITNSNNLQLLFCEQKQKKNTLGYVGDIQKQPALKLQQFIEGGQQSSFNEYSEHLNINEFKRSKEKSNLLNKVYTYVKKNNQYEFKDMSMDNFTDKSMLSVAYYIQNEANMGEIDKKAFKRKLKFVD